MGKKKQKAKTTMDIDKQITIGLERNDGTVNQDPGDVNATTESNTQLQGNVSNTPDTNSNNVTIQNSSLDRSIDEDSNHKVVADSIQTNINQESNTTCGPGEISNRGNSHEMNRGNDSLYANNETGNNADFDQSKLNEQMENILGKDKEKNNDTVDTEIKRKDGNNETNTEKKGEISCPKENKIQNELQSSNKETGPDANTIEEQQVFSDAKCETVEENTTVEIIIQAFSEIPMEQKQGEIEKEPPRGHGTEPVGNTTEDQRGLNQETRDNSEEGLKLNDTTNETAQITNKPQSEDEIYHLPTLNNTGDTSAAIQNGGDQNNCSTEPPINTRDRSVPVVEENTGNENKHCVEAPFNIGDNSKPMETTGDKNNCSIENIVQPPPNVQENSTSTLNAGDSVIQQSPNNKENPEEINYGDKENQNIEHTPSSVCENTTSTAYRRCCYCYCCYCGRLRCYNRCCCQACCRPNDNTAPVCRGNCQNCSRLNNEPNTSSVNEPTNPAGHCNCQNDSRTNVTETTDPVFNTNCQNRPAESNNEPSASVCDGSFRPIHTSSPLKRKSNEQNELEPTPSKGRKLFQNEDPNESRNGDNYDKRHNGTVCERNNGKPRENEDDKRNSTTVCEICHDKSKTRCERCHNTKCENCERHFVFGYDAQNCRVCRPCSNRNRCDYWANNKATQTDEECIVNPNEKSTQTCFAGVKDAGRTLSDDTKEFREESWAEDNKNNPRQTGRLRKNSFDKQQSDNHLYRDDTQPPVKKKKENNDMRKYEQYHNNVYLNYYVRLFREERFQGIRASEVAKYAGHEWRNMSEKKKRPYHEMRKLATPKGSVTKNNKTNKWMME